MHRIVVLGCAGTGKTTFARRLGKRRGAPAICLDELWRPEWAGFDLVDFRRVIAEQHGSNAWVSDGNFAKVTFDLRLPRADLIVWLEAPRLLCTWRAMTRVVRRSEAHRLRDITKVIRFIWKFNHVNRPIIESERLLHGPNIPVLHLNSTAEAERFLEEAN